MIYIVGLGNPGKEYENSRHNAGRMAVNKMLENFRINDLEFNKKASALVASGNINKEKLLRFYQRLL
jgi:peptidyl-tRNA hydrolase, PTH1 family